MPVRRRCRAPIGTTCWPEAGEEEEEMEEEEQD
jgi:hypothetical protein